MSRSRTSRAPVRTLLSRRPSTRLTNTTPQVRERAITIFDTVKVRWPSRRERGSLPQAVRPSLEESLEERDAAFGDAVDETQDRDRRSEYLGDEVQQHGIEHLARHVVEQADQSGQPKRPRCSRSLTDLFAQV